MMGIQDIESVKKTPSFKNTLMDQNNILQKVSINFSFEKMQQVHLRQEIQALNRGR